MDEDGLLKIISTITSNAVGEDGISIKDIKLCLPFCKNPLINIVNTCIIDNQYPTIWKKAIIKPIAKVSNPKEISDLRPISILPAMSKIFEKHIYNQLLLFSDNNTIIPECQSGFREDFSTCTCLVSILNDVRLSDEEKNCTCLALLDFSKAFDTLNHDMLLAKLHYCGLLQNAVLLLRNFLIGRESRVAVIKQHNSDSSKYKPIKFGVPQGSILSPLLFSIYVSDMYKDIKYSKLQQYADDSQLYISINGQNLENITAAQESLIADLNTIDVYAKNHNLKLNATKSKILVLGSIGNQNIKNRLQVQLRNDKLPIVKEAKNLGIMFDSSLTFETHIKLKIKVAYLRLRNLYKLKKYLSSKQKYYLCDTLILSLFDYGDVVYGDSLSLATQKLIQKVQNSCMRFSYNIPYRHHITPYLNNSSILNMKHRRKLHMYNFIYRILKKNKPRYLNNFFVPINHAHNTRYNQNFAIPLHRTASFQRSFSFVGVQMWNDLSFEVRNLSPIKFSKYIRAKLFQQQQL